MSVSRKTEKLYEGLYCLCTLVTSADRVIISYGKMSNKCESKVNAQGHVYGKTEEN